MGGKATCFMDAPPYRQIKHARSRHIIAHLVHFIQTRSFAFSNLAVAGQGLARRRPIWPARRAGTGNSPSPPATRRRAAPRIGRRWHDLQPVPYGCKDGRSFSRLGWCMHDGVRRRHRRRRHMYYVLCKIYRAKDREAEGQHA